MAARATHCLRGHEIARVGRDAKRTCRQCKSDWYERHYADRAWRRQRQWHQSWYWSFVGTFRRSHRNMLGYRGKADELAVLSDAIGHSSDWHRDFIQQQVASIHALLDEVSEEPEIPWTHDELREMHERRCYEPTHRTYTQIKGIGYGPYGPSCPINPFARVEMLMDARMEKAS